MVPHRCFSTKTKAVNPAEERFRPLLRLIGYYGPEATRHKQAEEIMMSCAVQAHLPGWEKSGKVKASEFRPRQALIMAHVWMVHRKLHFFPKAQLSYAKLLQEVLFDELWDDTIKRIRLLKVPELTVDKHLKNSQKYSFAQAVEFDQAMAETNKADRLDKIAAGVWRHIFLATDDPNINVEHCQNIAKYIIDNANMVDNLSPEDVLEANFMWSKPRFPDTSHFNDIITS